MESFKLLRQSDDLVYEFAKRQRDDGLNGYKRLDADVWIVRHKRLGWVAISSEKEISGAPWLILPEEQSDLPPEGEWISKKGSKVYVYTLVYC
jgi:hypothetical protein